MAASGEAARPRAVFTRHHPVVALSCRHGAGRERAGGVVMLLGGQRVEFLGELLTVGVDFLLLAFLRARERLVELLLKA